MMYVFVFSVLSWSSYKLLPFLVLSEDDHYWFDVGRVDRMTTKGVCAATMTMLLTLVLFFTMLVFLIGELFYRNPSQIVI